MTTKTKRKPSVRKSEWSEKGEIWHHVLSRDATRSLCGAIVCGPDTALPDEEVPEEITCSDCKIIIAEVKKVFGVSL